MERSVMWFRRDLRLAGHPALCAAAAAGEVVPLFVVDPLFTARAGAPRRAFLASALQALDDAMGGALVYRHGDPADVVPAFAAEVTASAVHVTRDHGPYGRQRDAEVSRRLAADGRRLIGTGSNHAVEPGRVAKSDGSPYAVFTPFSKAWRAIGWPAPLAAPSVDWVVADRVPCDGPPERPAVGEAIRAPGWAGEVEAAGRWEEFVADGLDRYDAHRDQPGVDGTSRMSAALRWGVVHPHQLLADLGPTRAHEVFANEVGWRDFYADVLARRPDSAWSNLQPNLAAMPVDTDARARLRFASWQEGRTGYPIVDAGMRQLLTTGWMHNRVRMIVASFLVKDLHLPWQWGAKHFMAHLVDGDLASNSHGWQWTAGTGTDAAPYFRVFNPTSQAERFDPEGAYVRRWVPELADLDGTTIHTPAGRVRLGDEAGDYPSPIVDHAAERDEALRRYRSVTAERR